MPRDLVCWEYLMEMRTQRHTYRFSFAPHGSEQRLAVVPALGKGEGG